MDNDLSQIDGKFYKKCKVIMLPTDKASLYLHNGILYNNKTTMHIPDGKQIPQHLYIISNERCKQGEWKYCSFTNKVTQYDEFCKIPGTGWCEDCKKIIATTDSALRWNEDNDIQIIDTHHCKFPRPSDAFIKKYVEKQGKIGEVLVEYVEEIPEAVNFGISTAVEYDEPITELKLKVAPDNTITIKPSKESWSREEVRLLICKYALENGNGWTNNTTDKWINDNL